MGCQPRKYKKCDTSGTKDVALYTKRWRMCIEFLCVLFVGLCTGFLGTQIHIFQNYDLCTKRVKKTIQSITYLHIAVQDARIVQAEVGNRLQAVGWCVAKVTCASISFVNPG